MIERLCFQGLWRQHSKREISIILGARQVGKSTLLRQLQAKAERAGLTTLFFDLEQPSHLQELAGNQEQVIQKLGARSDIVFIDEFHYLKNASKIFKAIYDSNQKVKVYASGSSSLEIHKHLKESLAGRFLKTMVFPFSGNELSEIRGFDLSQYLQWGGLPGLLHQKGSEAKGRLLENILSTYITKDVKGLIREENVRAFNSLLYSLAQAQGSISCASNLARETGLSESTVSRHLELMSQTYVLYGLNSYSTNLANELKKSKKYYFYDLGIRNILLKDLRKAQMREDKGVLYETAVLLNLIPQLKPNMEIRFWRTKKQEEVDFILLKNRIPVPMEVKSALQKLEIPYGISLFMRKYPKAPFGMVFNTTLEETVSLPDRRKIYFKSWENSASLKFMQSLFD